MIRPEPIEIHAMAQLSQPYIDFISRWYAVELNRLPNVTDSTKVAQGRCQVLNELVKLANEAPHMAAEQRKTAAATS